MGITRAKHRLTVTYTQSRAKYGQREAVRPSRFLYEMHGKKPPDELVKQPKKPVKRKARRRVTRK